jgi:hypothetical protein
MAAMAWILLYQRANLGANAGGAMPKARVFGWLSGARSWFMR